MTPYFQDDAVTIYHGDCCQIAPLLGRFDLLLTAPPYGMQRAGKPKSTSSHGGHKGYENLGWDKDPPKAWVLRMLFDMADKHIIWGGNYFPEALAAQAKWLVWDKGQRIDQADAELAYTTLGGALRVFTLNRAALAQDGAEHPTQKPERLICWCIEQAGDVQTILDPFAGSGTTGRAAKDLGKRAVLIEREERYCEIAAKRMSQQVLDFGGS